MKGRSLGNERFILSRAEENQSNILQHSQTKQACSNSSSLKHTSLFPSAGPAFSHSPYVHTHTLHMWGKSLAEWLAAVKQWGPVRVSQRVPREPLQVYGSAVPGPYSLPRGERICWMWGNKNIPRLVCTHHRFRGTTEPAHMNNRRPIQPSCWDNLSTSDTSFNLTRTSTPQKNILPPKQLSGSALPCSLPVKTQQTGSDRFLGQIPKKSFKDVFIRDYKDYKQTVSDLFSLLAIQENWFFSSHQIVFNDIYYNIFSYSLLRTNKLAWIKLVLKSNDLSVLIVGWILQNNFFYKIILHNMFIIFHFFIFFFFFFLEKSHFIQF